MALALSHHPFHLSAKSWLTRKGGAKIAFCRMTQLSFLRLMTTTAVTAPYGAPPLNNEIAWSMYEDFRRYRRITFVHEPSEIDLHWKRRAAGSTASPKLWMDAYLAAFAVAGNYRVLTTDGGFRQFADLKVIVLDAE
jgi:toxin-antitoxin system PIN domain toxin